MRILFKRNADFVFVFCKALKTRLLCWLRGLASVCADLFLPKVVECVRFLVLCLETEQEQHSNRSNLS